MMHTRTLYAFAGILVLTAGPAMAVTITNQDGKEHTLTIDHGAKESARKIGAGEQIQIDCPERCGFRVVGSGYGRQPSNDGKLIINKQGMLQSATDGTATGMNKDGKS